MVETYDGNIVIENNPPRNGRDSRGYGIKFFPGSPLPAPEVVRNQLSTIDPGFLRDVRHVWRPEETVTAASIFFEQGKLNIEGSPQNGKGTILFGLSEICDHFGWGHIFIDGHWVDSPTDFIIKNIREANERRFCIFYDSTDYLFLKNQRLRKLNKDQHRQRTDQITAELNAITVPICTTQHDLEWSEKFLDPDLVGKFASRIPSPTYQIPTALQSNSSIRRFLIDHDVIPADAEYFTALNTQNQFIDTLINFFGDKNTIENVLTASRHYPVLKKLIRFYNGDFRNTLHESHANIPNSSIALAQMIQEAEYERIFLSLLRSKS